MGKIFIHIHKKFAAVFSSDQFLIKEHLICLQLCIFFYFFDRVKIHRLIKLTQLTDATAVESKSSYFDITVK